MPIYEYECPNCGRFEIIQKIGEKSLLSCPACIAKGKKTKVTRAISAAAFHLKGSGWYKTDYAAKNGASNENGNTATSGDTKPGDAKPSGDTPPKVNGVSSTR